MKHTPRDTRPLPGRMSRRSAVLRLALRAVGWLDSVLPYPVGSRLAPRLPTPTPPARFTPARIHEHGPLFVTRGHKHEGLHKHW
jgi:hypothetical protein